MNPKSLTWKIVATTAALTAVVLLANAAARAPSTPDAVARGKYLVDSIGCADCHSPLGMGASGPERDPARHLSGHPQDAALGPAPALTAGWGFVGSDTLTAWSGPWGTSFTANLTPDRETGLGTWTAEQFVETIRNRRHLGRGRPLLPPMPAEFYGNLSDADLRAIFAYLQSIPAVRNRVPEPLPPAGS
jgi:Cytochrome c